MSSPLRLLFVCVENSCRSQVAEGWARFLGGDAVEAHSAGSRPSGQVNPKALESMARAGIELDHHRSQPITDFEHLQFDWVVTMGCGDDCPWVPARHREDWAIPDPKHMEPGEFDAVRDTIRRKVETLLARAAADELEGGAC